jgi:hypothetical protein
MTGKVTRRTDSIMYRVVVDKTRDAVNASLNRRVFKSLEDAISAGRGALQTIAGRDYARYCLCCKKVAKRGKTTWSILARSIQESPRGALCNGDSAGNSGDPGGEQDPLEVGQD